ncbi:MAG: hypothetical protein GX235_08740 [Clostridiales bacterium]|nr:hypothetical protein [Clostridiales bacterium]
MPDCSVTQELTGKSAQDIFSTDLFIKEIKKSADKLQIDISSLEEKSLPLYLETCLKSDQPAVSSEAHRIIKLFGERLAVILLCLKEGSPENRAARLDWSDVHWNYWNSLEHIILVGGLASPPLGEQLKQYMEHVFVLSGKKPYNIILGKDSTYAALRGCSTYLANNSAFQVNLIFDYGQSFIKRSYVTMENGQIKDIVILEKTLSRHVEWDIEDPNTEKSEAALLNNHFLETIAKTICEVEKRGLTIHPHIILSIANYVKDGVIANRGGYGKLRLIAPNYADYLSAYLREKYNKEYYFTLVHDGTAMAAGYSNHTMSVCLSLGTAFGVGFPRQ